MAIQVIPAFVAAVPFVNRVVEQNQRVAYLVQLQFQVGLGGRQQRVAVVFDGFKQVFAVAADDVVVVAVNQVVSAVEAR